MEIEIDAEDLTPAVPITVRSEYGAPVNGTVHIQDKDDADDAPTVESQE